MKGIILIICIWAITMCWFIVILTFGGDFGGDYNVGERGSMAYGDIYEGACDKDTGRLIEGKRTTSNGDIYECTFDKDTGRLIEGKRTTSNGDIVEGKWNKDTGTMTHRTETLPDGTVIKGVTDEVGIIKEGTYLYTNGNKYTGTFKNNLPHGRGTINYYSGSSWSGRFMNGKRIIFNTVDDMYTFSPDDQAFLKSIQISSRNEMSDSENNASKKLKYIRASKTLCNSPVFGPVGKLREDWVGELSDIDMDDTGEISIRVRINDIGNDVWDSSLSEELNNAVLYLIEDGFFKEGDTVVFSGYLQSGQASQNECIATTSWNSRPELTNETFIFTFTDIEKF